MDKPGTDTATGGELDQAPRHVQLAVDLIMLLEQHQIPADEALQALAIVTQDFERKLAQADQSQSSQEQQDTNTSNLTKR